MIFLLKNRALQPVKGCGFPASAFKLPVAVDSWKRNGVTYFRLRHLDSIEMTFYIKYQ